MNFSTPLPLILKQSSLCFPFHLLILAWHIPMVSLGIYPWGKPVAYMYHIYSTPPSNKHRIYDAALIWMIDSKGEFSGTLVSGSQKNFWAITSHFHCHFYRCVNSHMQWWRDLFLPNLIVYYSILFPLFCEKSVGFQIRRCPRAPPSNKHRTQIIENLMSAVALIQVNTVCIKQDSCFHHHTLEVNHWGMNVTSWPPDF